MTVSPEELAALTTRILVRAAVDRRRMQILQCVGRLYPSILADEIEQLLAHYDTLKD